MTTPEQEALADTLEHCRRLVAGAERDHGDYTALFPLDEERGAAEPAGAQRHLIRSFSKSFEQLQDQFSRKLLRAILSVAAKTEIMSGHRKLDAIIVASAERIGFDLTLLRNFATIRNSLAHDYTMEFSDIAPILNQAWRVLPELIGAVSMAERFIIENRLLEEMP